MFCVKIHRSYRTVVAICDSEIIGKKFEEGSKQLDLRENFFKDEIVDEQRLVKIIQMQLVEDATFNIVGKNSVNIALETGAINQSGVSEIAGIPFALKLI